VASRADDCVARVEAAPTMRTSVGEQINHGVHTLDGYRRPRVAGMARLTAWLAAALQAPTSFALASREAVGGRRLGGHGRILLAQCELSLQIGDALDLLSNLALAFGELPSQAFNLLLQALLGVLAWLSLGPRHASHGTPIGSICTGP
jgi:hypothetical protein